MSAEEILDVSRAAVETELARGLEEALREVPVGLKEAMRYAVLPGGKRLRPAVVLAVARAVSGKPPAPAALRFAAAVELVHCYSLIHDDLPAMDDDDLRRGRPTVHRAFGEAAAILAGDALLTEAFAWTAAIPEIGAALTVELAQAAGAAGMVGGQALDVATTGNRAPAMEMVTRIHEGKTGALFAAAAAGGARCGDGSAEWVERMRRYGLALGMAFQASDDLLDITGNPALRGKRVGRDAERQKPTLVAAVGLPKARARAEELSRAASEWVAGLPGRAPLIELALYAAGRSR